MTLDEYLRTKGWPDRPIDEIARRMGVQPSTIHDLADLIQPEIKKVKPQPTPEDEGSL